MPHPLFSFFLLFDLQKISRKGVQATSTVTHRITIPSPECHRSAPDGCIMWCMGRMSPFFDPILKDQQERGAGDQHRCPLGSSLAYARWRPVTLSNHLIRRRRAWKKKEPNGGNLPATVHFFLKKIFHPFP